MSRRKQSNPRHLDAELELGSLLENGPTTDGAPAPNSKDAHVCGECRAEFLDLEGFIAHKQTCTKKRIVVMIDAENRPGDNEIQPKSPSIEYDEEDLASQQDEIEAGSEENDMNDLDSVDMSEEGYGMVGMSGEKELDENDNFEDEEKKAEEGKDAEMLNQSKYELMSQLPHLFPFLPNTNVTLEPMSETKAAVAQFAENNLMPQDLAMMSATLYSLQQQQLVQLQLIQQLQQQLITGQVQNQPSPSATSVDKALSSSETPSPADTPTPTTPAPTEKKDKDSGSSDEAKPSVSKSSSSTTFTTPALSTPLPSSGLSAFSQLRKEAAVPASPMMPPVSSNISNSEPRYRGTMLERSQYASDDPFFKHKCRFCHKVFGSDSALQIHVRSHTGERPFKCNICGNRFSTRGNLKVHFERHKAKYPHAKMNPHPQPEHLERPMPLMGPFGVPPMPSLPSLPSLPSSMPLPPGLMTPPISTSLPMTSMGMGMIMPSPPIPVAPRPPPQRPVETPESKPKEQHSSPPPASEATSQKSPPEEAAPQPVKSSMASSVFPLSLSSTSATSTPSISSTPLMPSLSLPSPSMSMHPAMPSFSLPATPTSFPMPSPLASNLPLGPLGSPFGPLPPPPPPPPPQSAPPSSGAASSCPPSGDGMFRSSILPTKTIEPSEDLESYMECNKSETSKLEALVKNIEQKITDPNQCVICHRVLSCKSALQMHYRIHTGERPFRCKICSRSFTTKGNLKTHMGVHRSKPPLRMMHQCPVCHKQFTNLLVLQQHIRMHTGEPMHDIGHAPMYRPPDWTHKPHDFGKMFDQKPFDLSGSGMDGKELDLSKGGAYHDFVDRYGPISHDEEDNLSEQDYNEDDIEMDEDMEDMRTLHDHDVDMKDDKDPEDPNEEAQDQAEPTGEGDKTSATQPSPRETSSPAPTHTPNASGSDIKGTPVITSSYSSPFYNTSLAALEERVNAINSQTAQASFERFRNSMGLGHSPGLMEKLPTNYPMYQNGHRSPITSPRSPSVSEAGSEGSNMRDEHNPDAPLPFGHPMMGYGQLRPGSAEKKHTTCNICFKTFACRSALDIHYRSHTKERPYQCEVCDRSFTTRGNMKQHMLTHKIRDFPSQSMTGNSSDSQSGCTRSEPSSPRPDSPDEAPSAGLEPQSKSENPTRPTTPTPQTPPTSTPSQIPVPTSTPNQSNNNDENHNNNNNKSIHNSTPVHSQSLASSNHNSNSNSSDGSQFRRSGPKHQCMTCMKSFSSASALQIHTRTHTGDKPFKCNVCGKAFTTKGNLKVHMGTHMWSNSPSRRGRRMSIEPPFMLSHVKDNPFLAGFPHRPPDFYFQYPPFMNGMPHQKMNEISVIQSVNGGMNHYPPPMHHAAMGFGVKPEMKESDRDRELDRERERERHLSDGRGSEKDMDVGRENRDSVANGGSSPSESKHISSSGELDLSMRSSSSASANSSMLSSPTSKESPSDSSPYSSQSWLWKAGSCHFCNQTFQSQAALEQHIQTQHVPTSHVSGTDSHKALVA